MTDFQDTADQHHTQAVMELDAIKDRILGTIPAPDDLEIALRSAEELHRALWNLKNHLARRKTSDDRN